MNKDEKYYDLAKIIADKLMLLSPDNDYLKVNTIQIIKRKRELSEKELQELEEKEQRVDEPQLLCAINILLDNKRNAKKFFERMSEEDKEIFMTFPIYNLL